MFVIQDVPDITVPVVIRVPGRDEVASITARWKLHDHDVATEKIEQMRAGSVTDEQLVAADLLDAGPFMTPDNHEIPFTPELAQELLKKTYVRKPLLESWFAAQACREDAAAKN